MKEGCADQGMTKNVTRKSGISRHNMAGVLLAGRFPTMRFREP